jgi:hypothetical protein
MSLQHRWIQIVISEKAQHLLKLAGLRLRPYDYDFKVEYRCIFPSWLVG